MAMMAMVVMVVINAACFFLVYILFSSHRSLLRAPLIKQDFVNPFTALRGLYDVTDRAVPVYVCDVVCMTSLTKLFPFTYVMSYDILLEFQYFLYFLKQMS